MADRKVNIDELIVKHLNGELSDNERTWLNEWIDASERNRILFNQLTDKNWLVTEINSLYEFDQETVWKKILERSTPHVIPMSRGRRWWKYIAAASIILMLGTGAYFVFFKSKPAIIGNPVATNNVDAPKNTRASITLADGTKIYLDSAENGTLATQGSVKLEKTGEGEVSYSGASNEITYNTLTNPRGSKVVSLTLNDGTKVWLNSESSLIYPTSFSGNTREVEITGEAYFEVAHNANKPFHVKKGATDVTVLGTHFNVNAYDDEDALKVTLLEGSVKVTSSSSQVSSVIKPGEQAIVGNDIKVSKDVDVDQVMAWKDGFFQFDHTDTKNMLRQLARWYDVEVQYEGVITNKQFGGRINRELSLSEVLGMLKSSGVNFKIDGKKLIVMP
jgi:ferric-dicitrate binding protein FerR (iron transport regulator)